MWTIGICMHLWCLPENCILGKAALRLNITQPALSRQIRVLEDQLGMVLFTRDRRHVALTVEGTQLAAEARSAVSHYEKC